MPAAGRCGLRPGSQCERDGPVSSPIGVFSMTRIRKWHPFAERFAPITGDEWETFKASIQRTNGVASNPITYRIVNGEIQGLDGRNRYNACLELGIKPHTRRVRVADDEVIDYILTRNVIRRHLTPEQRLRLVARFQATGMSTR